MSTDDTLTQLVEVFRGEAPELVESINRALIQVETIAHPEERRQGLVNAARAAHNLKGIAATVENDAARDISHEMESIIERLRSEDKAEIQPFFDLGYELLDALSQAVTGELDEKRCKTLLRRTRGILANSRPVPAGEPSAPEPAPAPAPLQLGASVAPAPVAHASLAAQPPPAMPEAEVRSSGIRIDERKIERLMAQVAELRLAKIRAEQRLGDLRTLRDTLFTAVRTTRRGHETVRRGLASGTDRAVKRTEALSRNEQTLSTIAKTAQSLHAEAMRDSVQLSILTDELENEVRKIMTLPLGAALAPLHRVARDVARRHGKVVKVEISASGIEVDKRMLEELRDPLIHLVRNAVDHGIELPEDRIAAGKDALATLRITAEMRGALIALTIADDGRGVDRTKVLVAASERLGIRLGTDTPYEQVLDLLFTPGFSTAAELTDISGRGVGLDVVRDRVRALGGTVRIRSEAGKGTTFELLMSPTVSTTKGLLLEVAGQTLAMPVDSISRVMRISPTKLERVGGVTVLRDGDERAAPIPLVRLDELLGLTGEGPPLESRGADDRLLVIVIAAGDDRVAFVMDNVIGEQDMVVKPLPYPLKRVRNIAGAALRGNGEVLPVLAPADLVESARATPSAPPPQAKRAEARLTTMPRGAIGRRILVVDDALTTRTLEKAILEHAGYHVLAARSGREAWELLQHEIVDAVVTDVDMPEMNGFELLRRVRQHDRFGRLPVVLVTSLSSPQERARGMDLGASAYIAKGQFDQEQFLDVLATVI